MPRTDGRRIPWRNALLLAPVACSLFAWAGGVAAAALVAPKWTRSRTGRIARAWGRFGLRAFGVRTEIVGEEHLRLDVPSIVLFNHVSLLDVLLLAAHAPERPLVLYKRELGRLPFFGWALAATRMIPVDRAHRERAIASVAEAGRRIHGESAAVMIAPEGTRSKEGELGPFKLGAFHLAAETNVPVVPLVMHGIAEVLPHGSYVPRAGTVRIEVLPPIATDAWDTERVREHADEVRALFLERLCASPS